MIGRIFTVVSVVIYLIAGSAFAHEPASPEDAAKEHPTLSKSYQYQQCAFSNCNDAIRMKKSQTQEFRGQCTRTGTAVPPVTQHCKPSRDTTCTRTIKAFNYASCSCTNWSPTTQNSIVLQINC